MVRLQESQIIDILPDNIKTDTRVIALSYAISHAVKRIVSYADHTGLLAVIDRLPEDTVDILAIELRTQYYDETMDIATKRDLVKNTLPWYGKAGTAEAVQEMIDKVLGEGIILEWFDTGGTPGTFQISTPSLIAPELIEDFREIIKDVKNVRSRLVEIVTGYRFDIKIQVQAGMTMHKVVSLH